MRETQSLVSAVTVEPTFELIRNQFEAWRKRRYKVSLKCLEMGRNMSGNVTYQRIT